MPNVVECPNEDCDCEFDAVEASTGFVRDRDGGRTDIACPECESSWVDLHREVDPDVGTSDPGFKRGFNGDIERDEEVTA